MAPASEPEGAIAGGKRSRDSGYVVARAVGYGLIWLGWLLLAASLVAVTLSRYLQHPANPSPASPANST